MQSTDRGGMVAQFIRSGLSMFVYVLIYGFAAFRAPQHAITGAIVLIFLLLYIQFYVRNRFFIWVFYEDYILRKRPWGHQNTRIPYNTISSWQVRERFGVASTREFSPNYTETAFWTGPKTGYSIDEHEYLNYQAMHELFVKKMEQFGIEEAPYRD